MNYNFIKVALKMATISALLQNEVTSFTRKSSSLGSLSCTALVR